MGKKYVVTLTPDERSELRLLLKKGQAPARKLNRARILLMADRGKTDEAIADALQIGLATVERTRRKYVENDLTWALHERPRAGVPAKLSGRQEALLVALACSQAPVGYKRWSLQLLARRLVELKAIDSISDETVRRVLKKHDVKPWQEEQWCLPEVSAEFVWHMEDVLDLYEEPYNPRQPVVCFDECPYQLVAEVRQPLPTRPGQVARYDYEYQRCGSCNLFITFQPLRGWRHIEVTAQRTKQDFARCLQTLSDSRFPEAQVIRLVIDNLNTHSPAALYETFPPTEARRLTRRFEFHYTPKHASWLNMAELEWSVLSRQCLDRRIGHVKTLRRQIAAWERERNAQAVTAHWRFTTVRARSELDHLYPSKSLW